VAELPVNQILHGNCLEVLRTLPDASLDSVVCDPPYGLGNEDPTPEELLAYLQGADLETGDFMDRPWNIPPVAVWKECFRALKPGGHLLAFAGTRTQDLMAMGIRMAGFENRDTIATIFGPSVLLWAQSQGFPKNHDVSANIDRKLGMQREVIGTKRGVGGENLNDIVQGREVRQTTDEGGKGIGAYGVGAKQVGIDIPVTAPASEQAKQWEGWGSALKPSNEVIVFARKPFVFEPLWCSASEVTALLEGLLWLRSPAKFVQKSLQLSQKDFGMVESDSVRWIAAAVHTIQCEKRSDLTGMFASQEEASTYLSIVTLWSGILDALCQKKSTFTTVMAFDTITALRTLRYSLSKSTPPTMLHHVTQNDGLWLSVGTVKTILSEEKVKLSAIPTLTALESATAEQLTPLMSELVCFAETLSQSTGVQLVDFAGENATFCAPEGRPKVRLEPILMFRKPVAEKTVVDQVLKTGTGAINIGGCRIGVSSNDPNHRPATTETTDAASSMFGINSQRRGEISGRWPANLILVHGDRCKIIGTKKVKAPLINRFEDGMKPWGDGAGHGFTSTRTGDENGEEEIPVYECMEGCPAKLLDAQSGISVSRPDLRNEGSMDTRNGNKNWRYKRQPSMVSDAGGASRFFAQFMPDAPFFYCAKASSAEKTIASDDGELLEDHPTVKPLKLMAYLVRLVTPPKGIVLDPYCGSGTTCVAAVQEGMRFIGIDKHEPYVKRSRIRTREALGQAEEKTGVQSVFDLAMSDDE
jgi:DNA modification methylase